ncbi:Imm1 family immunity protein [Blastopirellula marina]|uniref:Immunity protein Imm1 n=1 Tax=Blastopirellula marina TaxID=124 RepID=A0A2S8GSD5_9BACT|nr:Imm1 family immunity protein [Blastopirellula marina]PQO47339.1 hypothetical protein C5Y93_04675 [Blastopirellula marina]
MVKMIVWKIQWNPDSEAEAASIAELDSILDAIHAARRAVMVAVGSPSNGDSLAIGLGRTVSVLNFVPGTGDPPYFSSVGADERDESVEFSFLGAPSEFPMRNAISVDSARNAMREFFETGKLSSSIEWEAD